MVVQKVAFVHQELPAIGPLRPENGCSVFHMKMLKPSCCCNPTPGLYGDCRWRSDVERTENHWKVSCSKTPLTVE